MPSRSIHDKPTPRREPSLSRPQKRRGQTPLAVCPTALALDQSLSDNQTTGNTADAVILSPPCSLNIEEWMDFECRLPLLNCTDYLAIDSLKPEKGDDDTLFDQYLRSPSASPSPSPQSASSAMSGATLVDVKPTQSRGSVEPHAGRAWLWKT